MRPPPTSKRPPKFSQWQPHIWDLSGAPVMIKQSVNSAFVISNIIYKSTGIVLTHGLISLFAAFATLLRLHEKQGRNDTFRFGSIRFRLLPFDFEYLDCYWPASPWLPALLTQQLATAFLRFWLISWLLLVPALVLLIWLWFLVNAFVCLEIISSPVNAASRQTW